MIMHSPDYFREFDQKKQLEFIKNYSFATIMSCQDNSLVHITKIPLLLDTQNEIVILEGHLARNNPHAEFLKQNPKVDILFDGPHGYISPTWYPNPVMNVPTWNYASVLIKGHVTVVDSLEWLKNSVVKLAAKYEKNSDWQSRVDNDFAAKLMNGIIGLEIKVESIEAKFKLGQNKDEATKNSVIQHLALQNPELAKLMKENFY